MQEVGLKTETIKLGQFLKLAGVALEGGEARELIAAGKVAVNSEPEFRRGRKLRVGDIVECGEFSWKVVAQEG